MTSVRDEDGLLGRPWAFWTMLIAATVLGAALRLHALDGPSFWVDEFFTIARAGKHPLHWTHAVGYLPTRLSLWLHGADLGRIALDDVAEWPALGVSERAARLGACWVGIVTVPILGLLTRALAGSGVAGASALLVAIIPWHLYWSQMARFYTTEFLFANVFVLLFARGALTGSRGSFAVASAAAVLAYLTHSTAIFVVGACIAAVGLMWIARVPLPHLGASVRTLGLITGACGLVLLIDQSRSSGPSPLGTVAGQSWDPSLWTLILGTVLRVEPVVCAAGLGWVIVAVRRRDPFGILVSSVAVLVPLGVLALKPLFPIGQRYYLPCLFAWAMLASMWSLEIDRRLGAIGGRVVGATGLAVLLVAVSFSTYLYCRDGSGARARWREACEYVLEHGDPSDPVFTESSGFEAEYYLGRKADAFPSASEVASLAPGSWLIHRTRGALPPLYGDVLDVKARYEIPSKPWSWVLYVMRVPLARRFDE